jgi:site-specific DNA-methyltransferase (adenine-specific)
VSGIIREEQIGPCRLILGDCLDVLPLIGKVDAVVTDPPYGIAYCKGTGGGAGNYKGSKSQLRNIEPIHGDDKPFDPSHLLGFDNVLMFGVDHFADKVPTTGRWLAWNKIGQKEQWDSFSDVEFAWHSRKGASRIVSYMWKGLCQGAGVDKGEQRDHPTQKPICVMEWCIAQAGCTEGDLILDPYMGVGTTGVAAVRLGMRFVGVEIVEKYFDIAVSRIRRAWQDKQSEIKFEEPPPARQLTIEC